MAIKGQEMVNTRTGQRIIFRQTARDTNGTLLQMESINAPHSMHEPEHVHPRQESTAEVLAGALRFRVGGVERTVRAGEKIVIPSNTPHSFWNDGDEDACSLQEFRPALRTECFFETYFSLARDGKIGENGMPSLLRLAVLVPEFSNEIRPTTPPWPLLRVITWILNPIARLLGYRSTYP